jgi:nucleotide-binding universal stress UspA family protein
MFKKILVPLDLREPDVAREALATAEALARAFGGELRLVYVMSPIAPVIPMAAIPQHLIDDIGATEQVDLAAAAAKVSTGGLAVSTAVRIGSVYPELLSEAEEWGADHIVVGAHRRSMATFLLGSTAAALARHAKCCVTIVRSPLKASFL